MDALWQYHVIDGALKNNCYNPQKSLLKQFYPTVKTTNRNKADAKVSSRSQSTVFESVMFLEYYYYLGF